ncbi:MAG TPA: glycosyltransferase [Chryseobacterium sp.]|nr:glycosyltransferase [Chryseobacterium sp.]
MEKMEMKQKLLFVINNLNVGGSEKALISLLNELDYTKFEVDLQLFKKEGLFLNDLPAEVNLLPVPKSYRYFDGSFKKALRTLNLNLIFNRYKFSQIRKVAFSGGEAEQLGWKYLSKTFRILDKKYDVAIGYLEKNPNYFVVDKVQAKTKIGFIHNDYSKIDVNSDIDRLYFDKLNYICSVSEHCVHILKEYFPSQSQKIKLIPNLFSEKLILKKSEEEITEIEFDKNECNILSVGRLAEQKGFDLAIDTAFLLKERGFKFKWFILGEGSLRKLFEEKIEKLNLESYFFLLGNHTNPYKFMKNADLILQTSRFEGKSIAIDEAKLLNKIIVVTNYPTVKDQITHNVDGCISSFASSDIADQIVSVYYDKELKNNLQNYLENNRLQNENKLLELF